jgi:hypothetical protein
MIQQEFERCPKTYHTPRADATYEQCPWDWEHVEALYPRLAGIIATDGEWHDFPPVPEGLARYRVFEERYLQVAYARAPHPVFEALTSMDPVELQDDSEWEIWQEGEGAYAMSTTFALTPGQFEHQAAVDEWLWRHGLGLEPNEYFVEGVAYFTDIEAGCVQDAMERLAWLERAFDDLNERLEQTGRGFWQELKAESDAILQKLDQPLAEDEIAPLPDRYRRRRGWKYREPIRVTEPSHTDK